jgi:hypothetical protein
MQQATSAASTARRRRTCLSYIRVVLLDERGGLEASAAGGRDLAPLAPRAAVVAV